MTSPRTWGATAMVVITLGLPAGGCGSGSGGGSGSGSGSGSEERALTAPAATGTGPYPTPSATRTNPPVLPKPKGTGKPRGTTIRPQDVDRTDADAVSRGALTSLWTFDAATDRGPHDAGLRAADAGWLTRAYADRLRAHRPPVPDAQWREWVEHRAYTTVALTKAEDAARPPGTETEAWRQWIVTATPSGNGRWKGEPVIVVVYVHLTRTVVGEPWRVANVTVR
ncbi:hypothetical protein P3L51_32315 [Streptomyces sp. PSRA5]|uniref:hypothetical protein n=1 Tax=Streptomyces panacea TaxID=3035064 RepID=UPI00339CF758